MGREPATIWDALNCHKDMQYSSRFATHIDRQRELQSWGPWYASWSNPALESEGNGRSVQNAACHGCQTHMHVVLLLAPRLANENQIRDIDFRAVDIYRHWEAGLVETTRALEHAPWNDKVEPLEGAIGHPPISGAAEAKR